MLYFTSCDYFVTANFYLLIPSPFSPIPPTHLPYGNHQSILCICESVSILFESLSLEPILNCGRLASLDVYVHYACVV